MITDFVSGLAGLPEAPVLAGTGWATAFLAAAGAAGLPKAFLAAGLAAALSGWVGAAFFGTGLADAVLDAAAGLTTAFTTGLGFLAGLAALTGVVDLTGFADFATDLTLLPPAGRAAAFGAALAFGAVLVDARTTIFTAPLAGVLVDVAGFFLVVAFTIGLLWK